MATSNAVSLAVFAAFWLVLVYGVMVERERAKGVRQ